MPAFFGNVTEAKVVSGAADETTNSLVRTMRVSSSLLLLCAASTKAQVENAHHAYPGWAEKQYHEEYSSLLRQELKHCLRRENLPETGSACSSNQEKTCLFGEQTCPDASIEPTSRCICSAGVWNCQAWNCPTLTPECPDEPPVGLEICKADIECSYQLNATCCSGHSFATKYCSCDAGQPLNCVDYNPCEDSTKNCYDLHHGNFYPPPQIFARDAVQLVYDQIDPNTPGANVPQCPADRPSDDFLGTCDSSEGSYDCHYGFSCCCPDLTQCSSDLKCTCSNGSISCAPKHCDSFLCAGGPNVANSPFQQTVQYVHPLCPSYDQISALPEGQAGVCESNDLNPVYHCTYGFECCCGGRGCGPEYACTCSDGRLTCIGRDACPPCGTRSSPNNCPATLPEPGSGCPLNEGVTCGYDEMECCDGAKFPGSYCLCAGGEWTEFVTDTSFLCANRDCSLL